MICSTHRPSQAQHSLVSCTQKEDSKELPLGKLLRKLDFQSPWSPALAAANCLCQCLSPLSANTRYENQYFFALHKNNR